MNTTFKRIALASLLTGIAGVALAQDTNPAKMSFFVTSVGSGKGGDLGGLAGADKHCTDLATAAGSRGKTWHAYLSATAASGKPAVNAKDRIGKGPWLNAKGEQIAASVADLHSDNNKLTKETALTEKGTMINGVGDTPNQHDMLTGSSADGTLAPAVPQAPPPGSPEGTPMQPAPENMTCNNWTSSGPNRANLGHHDRKGRGAAATSWNASHASRSCSQPDLVATGGNGLFYCFATN